MPVFVLCIKAELENVGKLSIRPGASFCMSVKEGAGSEVRDNVHVSSTEQHELTGSKGTANLVMKFAKGSKKEASVNVMEIKGVTRAYTAEDDGKFVPIMGFECRGLEPIEFTPEGDDWLVESVGGQKYDGIDLSEREWCDFDEKAGISVGIYKFEGKFELHRGS